MTLREVGIIAVAAAIGALAAITLPSSGCSPGDLSDYEENSVSYIGCAESFIVRGVGSDVAIYQSKVDGTLISWDIRRHVFTDAQGNAWDVAGRNIATTVTGNPDLRRCPVVVDGSTLFLQGAAVPGGDCSQFV